MSDPIRRIPPGSLPRRQVGRAGFLLAGVICGALGAGLIALLLVADDTGPVAEPIDTISPASLADATDSVPPDTRAELQQALRTAAAERSQLAATLVSLARDVDELAEIVSTMQASMDETSAERLIDSVEDDALTTDDSPGSEARGDTGGVGDPANPAERRRRRPDEPLIDALLAAGIDPVVASGLQQRSDAWQLARLELVDQASREGWGDSGQFEQRLDELDAERPDLRTELGDDAWDRYLYESGAANRVSIGSVIPGSAAAAAGLDEGDLLLGYAGQLQFSTSDLQAATRAGSRGEPIMLEIERDGQTLTFEVPRGPLGVTLSPLRREP